MNALHNRFTYYLTILAISLFSFTVQAASFYATVNKNKVVKNEVFQLRVTSDQKASANDIRFNTLNRDFYVDRPNFGSSVHIVNGSRTYKSEWTVSLVANKVGSFTIPSFELNGDKTSPITIQVSNDAQEPDTTELVEVQTHLSNNDLYPSESALLKARLLIKADPRRLQNPSVVPPAIEGLELKAANEADQYQTVIDGVEVTIVDQDFRITAKDAGTFQLTEPVFKGTLIYGSSYNGGTRLIPVETTPKTYSITVNPKPDDYQGLWLPTHNLTLKQSWSDSHGNAIKGEQYSTKVGESITRELTLQISGLTQEQLPNIKITYPDSLSVYDEKPQFTTLDNGDVVMTVKQVVIPRRIGAIELPLVSINWWNTRLKQQQATSVAGLKLKVEQSDAPLAAAPTPIQATANIETVTVKDAGIWPYLTGLFAFLWAITGIIAWRFKTSNVTPEEFSAKVEISDEYLAVTQALSTNDGITICAAIKTWCQTVNLTTEEQQQLNDALNEINASLYSSTPKQIQTASLAELIKKVHKQQKRRKKAQPSTLAKL